MNAPGTEARIALYQQRVEEREQYQQSIFDFDDAPSGEYLQEAVEELVKAVLAEAVDFPLAVIAQHRAKGLQLRPHIVWEVAQCIGWYLVDTGKVDKRITLEDCCEPLRIDPDVMRKEARRRLEEKFGVL